MGRRLVQASECCWWCVGVKGIVGNMNTMACEDGVFSEAIASV